MWISFSRNQGGSLRKKADFIEYADIQFLQSSVTRRRSVNTLPGTNLLDDSLKVRQAF